MNKIKTLLITISVLCVASICQAQEKGIFEAKLAKLEAAVKAKQSIPAKKTHYEEKTLAQRIAELQARLNGFQQKDGEARDTRITSLQGKLAALNAKLRSQQDDRALAKRVTQIEQNVLELKDQRKQAKADNSSDSEKADVMGKLELSTQPFAAAPRWNSFPTKPIAINFAKATDVPAKAKAKAKYKNMRQDEDFSYLGGPEGSYIKDRWDSIKWIPLGDDWHLTIGGQARARFESETDKTFGAGTAPSHDAYVLQRYLVHSDFKHGSGLRFFLQGKFAHANFRDRGGWAGIEDHADFHQMFMDVPLGSATWRVGRQELLYGKQRLISPLDWGNIRRTFDGVKVFTHLGDWKIDAFAVRPVINDRANLDDADEQVDFYGIYTTWKGSKALAADFYALLLKDNNDAANANSRIGRRTLYTIGNRLWGKRGNWDYETEVAAQFGTFAGDSIRAWMATAGLGYTFSDAAWKPRVGLLYDYASGDTDKNDGTHGSFNQLYPLAHAWLGYADKVARSNIHAIKAQLKVKPSKKLTAWVDFHTFYADQDQDTAATRTPTAADGGGSHFIGHELDITMKYAFNRHTTVLAGWAHLFTGGFIERTGTSEDVDFLYGQIEYKF